MGAVDVIFEHCGNYFALSFGFQGLLWWKQQDLHCSALDAESSSQEQGYRFKSLFC